jgi:hypothetical protein
MTASAPSARAQRRASLRKVPALKLTAPTVREHPAQIQIAAMLRLEIGPPGKVSRHGVTWWACDSEEYFADVPYTRTERGLIKGPQDIYILYRGMAHHPEIKTEDGVMSKEQQQVAAAVLCAGGKVAVVRDSTDMLHALDEWSIPRNRRVRISA